ncbi:pathogen-associated molecular patterns-induced protein A70-like [Zingiber officinale]|uniref:pathogen-associated molecular patterns-induced protein A70-like n=1 Tax=Zingiber officinale TaxID=94328 RepID=UPI001C4BB306|nr:pathogen-associated molecular patterns-induced protein A70-like [Zingiber officinale]
MLDQWLPSTLASIFGWFTPTVLFVLVNIVIGTIAIASKFSSHHHHHHHHNHNQASAPALDEVAAAYPGGYLFRSLSRSPSLVLDRLRSFNLNRHVVELSPPLEEDQAPHLGAKEKEEEADDEHQLHLDRSQSDAHPTGGEMPPKLAVRIKKSASEKSPFAHFEETEIENAAAASREAADQVENDGVGGGEVDARADDFINRFRQQLKLQRLDSILRYKEMLGRGST